MQIKKTVLCLVLIFLTGHSFFLFSQDIQYARKIVKDLSSAKFYGRGYVNKGDKKAAGYIAEEYRKFGIIPFEKSYFQSFPVNVNTFPSEIECRINGKNLKPGEDFLVDPSSGKGEGLYVPYIVDIENLLADSSYLKHFLKAQGKLMVIRMKELDPHLQKKAKERITYLKYGRDQGLKGVVFLSDEKLSWNVAPIQGDKPVFTILKKAVEEPVISTEFKIKPKLISGYTTQNILGYIPGTQQPDTFLVITAHYDHLGKMGKSAYFPGANDNASGVAMLLNLAQYYSQHPQKYSVAFFALSAEELGIKGAEYFTEHPVFELNKIKFLCNLDLLGNGEEGITVVNGSVYPDKFTRLEKINEINQYLPVIKSRGEACNSDHCMFYKKGVPCFFIYTMGGSPAYHDINDRYENLAFPEFEDIVKLLVRFFDHL
ncbi:MAG: M28 family peptidase [Bacteroidales bacterium]|nr:M28 family peptidase [Bacteroidales bacterium]